jgi:hypothetical protein
MCEEERKIEKRAGQCTRAAVAPTGPQFVTSPPQSGGVPGEIAAGRSPFRGLLGKTKAIFSKRRQKQDDITTPTATGTGATGGVGTTTTKAKMSPVVRSAKGDIIKEGKKVKYTAGSKPLCTTPNTEP